MSTIDNPTEFIKRDGTIIPIIEKPDNLTIKAWADGEGTYNRIFNIPDSDSIYRVSKYTTLVPAPAYLTLGFIKLFDDAIIKTTPSDNKYWTPDCSFIFQSGGSTPGPVMLVAAQEAKRIGSEQTNMLFSNKKIYEETGEFGNVIPEIYFNGLVKLGPENLYSITKLEKYSLSVKEFYNKNQASIVRAAKFKVLRPIDYVICSQLLYINYCLARLGYLCTDVKPGNYVINTTGIIDGFDPTQASAVYSIWQRYLEEWKAILSGADAEPPPKDQFHDMLKNELGLLVDVEVDVRAIDLETDMCNKQQGQKRRRGADIEMTKNQLRVESFLLQNLLLSSVCLTHLNWNIFSGVFVDTRSGLFQDTVVQASSNVLLYSKLFMNTNFIRNTLHYLEEQRHEHSYMTAFIPFLKKYLDSIEHGIELTTYQISNFIVYYMRFALILYTTKRNMYLFNPPTAAAAAPGPAAADDERTSTETTQIAASRREENTTTLDHDVTMWNDATAGPGFFTIIKRGIRGVLNRLAARAEDREQVPTPTEDYQSPPPQKRARRGGTTATNRTKKYKKHCHTKKYKKKSKKKSRKTKKHGRKPTKQRLLTKI